MTFFMITFIIIGYLCSGFVACLLAWNFKLHNEDINKASDLLVLIFCLGYISLISIGAIMLLKWAIVEFNALDKDKIYHVYNIIKTRILK